MTLITLSPDSNPMYVITQTSDIVDNKVSGASFKGKILYDLEAGASYILSDDLTLADYVVTTSGGGGGSSVVTNAGTFAVQDNGANQGAMNETAPASDTASSGINGRLQRVAQRITSLIALLPAALGAGGGLKIDGSGTSLPVSGTFYQATQPISGNITADTELPAAATLADATTNPSTTSVGVDISGYNGTTWDRIRSGITTIGSTFTGFMNNLSWGIFNTSPTTRTTGQGGPLETASDGSLRVIPSMSGNDANIETSGSDATSNTQNNLTVTGRGKVYNGSTWDRLREATADALAVTGLQGIANMLWNGTTWDRAQSDATGKQKVSLYGKFSVAGDTALSLDSAGRPTVTIIGSGASSIGSITLADGGSLNSNTGLAVVNGNLLYNNTNWDRQRNNYEATILASAARTIATNSADITNYNARFTTFTIDITAVTGSPSLTFTVKYKDSLSGKYVTILASAALTGTGTTTLVIGPGLPSTANVSANASLPRLFRVEVGVGTADSVTYSVSANFSV